MKVATWLSLIVFISLQTTLVAQEYFTVQVGVFLSPRLSDFDNIRSLGYVYAEEDETDTYTVFVGDFDNATAASKVEQQLKQKGYLDATVMRKAMTFGQSVAVIQIATRSTKDELAWENFFKVGELFVLAENNQVKVVTGSYPSVDAAKADLKRVRSKGFKDAFPKVVNSARLHTPSAFELGEYKKELIPIEFDQQRKSRTIAANINVEKDFETKGEPTLEDRRMTAYSYESNEVAPATSSSSSTASLAVPKIRTNVKRRSALDLQKVLRTLKTYDGALDGFYGAGTADGFATAANNSMQYKKYQLLATNFSELSSIEDNTTLTPLQRSINGLWNNSSASLKTLEASKQPIAKAYRAYWLFENSGATGGVNRLMNEAIEEAFAGLPSSGLPPIDPKATYAYYDLETVIRHLTYVHQVQEGVAMPCWLFDRHATEVRNALIGNNNLTVAPTCNSFDEWEIVQILNAITRDMCSDLNAGSDQSKLSELYLAPTSLSQTEIEGLTAWNDLLWQNIKTWADRDPLHENLFTPLQLAYFQAQVQLEDHYMDRDFAPTQAKGLALAVLEALVGKRLERFM